MKQSSLFPHHGTSPKEVIRLVISKSKNKILSKEETAFNKFSQQIESLRKQIENDQKKFDKLSNFFSASVTRFKHPLEMIYFYLLKHFMLFIKMENLVKLIKKKSKRCNSFKLKQCFPVCCSYRRNKIYL